MTALPKLKDRQPTEIGLAGMAATLDLSGALFLASEDALVVADLHLEKGSSFASAARCCRPTTPARRCAALAEALDRFAPRTVIALGDSFHDIGGAATGSADDDRAALAALQARTRVDLDHRQPRPRPCRERIGGEVVGELTLRRR